MFSGREDLPFEAFKQQPTQSTLADLLRFHQDHIYNICFQILRHPEDAEDVAQEVLLEITRGIAKVDSPRQFKVWLYRVALRSALDLKKARVRRGELARRLASQPQAGGAPVDTEERSAIMQAMEGLDDRTRCLLLEHYFDKLTLDEIGQREGISSVAVWKRLERAKEQMRRALLGAGIAISGASVAQGLESVIPVVAPSGLVGQAVLAKAALVAAGGVAVATKGVITGGSIVAILLITGAAATGGYLVGSSRSAAEQKTVGMRRAEVDGDTLDMARAKDFAKAGSPRKRSEDQVVEKEEGTTSSVGEKSGTSTETVVSERARRLDTLWERAAKEWNSERDSREMLRLMSEADSTWTKHFVALYKERLAKGQYDHGLLSLMRECGGDDLAKLYADRLQAADASEVERGAILRALSGRDFPLNYMARLGTTPNLVIIGYKFMASQDPEERAAAAGIMGGVGTGETRSHLISMMNDPAIQVKEAAVRSLGLVGDQESLTYLRNFWKSYVSQEGDNEFRKAWGHTIQEIEGRLRK